MHVTRSFRVGRKARAVLAVGALGLMVSSASLARAQVAFTPGALIVDATGNNVLEPNETAGIRTSWTNIGMTMVCNLGGSVGGFSGPGPATYAVVDPAGRYDGCFFPQGGTLFCSDCYSIRIDAAARPAPHWDATASEGPAGIQIPFALHVGGTFADVAATSPFYRYVETLVHARVTTGCAPTAYCPTAPVSREQMALFVLVAKGPAGYVPPACGTPMFADVPASSPFCRWIEELARRGVVAGCGGGSFCPTADVTREQVTVFVQRTAAPMYTPPACTTPLFADVPASSPFCRWIEDLARRGIVSGCGGGNYCPDGAVSREQMSVYTTLVFGLTLYRR